MIITNEKRLLSIYIHSACDKTFFIIAGMAPVNHGGFAPVIQGGNLPSDRGASPPQNFDCGGDHPQRPCEVGAYAYLPKLCVQLYRHKVMHCQ